MTEREALKLAQKAMGLIGADLVCEAAHHEKKDRHQINEPCPIQARWHRAFAAIKEVLAQPEQKYRRGDRLVCLETDEYCVIHIAGTDRQWVKFPDTHIGFYTNEQVDELFEKLAKETDSAQPEQEPDDLTIAYMSGVHDGKKKRTWVGLTEQEAADCWSTSAVQTWREIEAKLKDKNT